MQRFYAHGIQNVISKLEPLATHEIRRVKLVVRPLEENLARRIGALTRICDLLNRITPTNPPAHAAVLIDCDEFSIRLELQHDGLSATCAPLDKSEILRDQKKQDENRIEAQSSSNEDPIEIHPLVGYRNGSRYEFYEHEVSHVFESSSADRRKIGHIVQYLRLFEEEDINYHFWYYNCYHFSMFTVASLVCSDKYFRRPKARGFSEASRDFLEYTFTDKWKDCDNWIQKASEVEKLQQDAQSQPVQQPETSPQAKWTANAQA